MLLMSEYAENFEAWCADCVRITDKMTGASVPFRLNAPQRRVAEIMEGQRKAGKPIRIIMLKARQWGGSTLTQVYMAWMQLVRHKGWNSLICSHVKDASANIRGMYSHLLRSYPEELRGGETDPKRWVFTPYEKSSNIGYIPARDCRVAVTSAYAPDAVRGASFQMAHLSEVAFWGDGDNEVAERIVRTVGGSVPMAADTIVVMESTADGTDNYFYREWERAVRGESDKTAVFVPWYEIEIYTLQLSEEERRNYPATFDDYELALLHKKGLDVAQVAWYHCKRKEYSSHEQMMAEYPSTPAEAFARIQRPWLTSAESGSLRSGRLDDDTEIQFAVMVAGSNCDDNCLIGIIAKSNGGTIGLKDERSVHHGISAGINALSEVSKTCGIECAVTLPADSEISPRWLERKLADKNVKCLCSDEERCIIAASTDNINEMRNCWNEMLLTSRWIETQESMLSYLKELSATKAGGDAHVLLRLTIASVATTSHDMLQPTDFY